MKEYKAEDLRNELKPWIEELERKIIENREKINIHTDQLKFIIDWMGIINKDIKLLENKMEQLLIEVFKLK